MAQPEKSSEDVAVTFIQPNVKPREGKPGRLTNCLKQFEGFLNSVRRAQYCAFFLEPVDMVKHFAFDYYDVIKEPMDIGTILMRLKNRYYYSVTEAFADFQQILKNCFKYNREEHECYKCGLLLKRSFQRDILKYPDVEEVILKAAQLRTKKKEQTAAPSQPPVIEEPPPPHIVGCKELLNALLSHCPKSMGHFATPLVMKLVHTDDRYNDVIVEPMDVLTIRTKLKFLLYKDLNEFVYDMRLIYLNGLKTYAYGTKIFDDVQFIRNSFENILSFYRTFERLPNKTEMPLINTPWKLSFPRKEDSPKTITFKVVNEVLYASFVVPMNERMEIFQKLTEAADAVEKLDHIREKYEQIIKIEKEAKPLRTKLILEEDLALSDDDI